MAKLSDTVEMPNDLNVQFRLIAPRLDGQRFRTFGRLANALAEHVYNPWCFDGPKAVKEMARLVLGDPDRSAAIGIERVVTPTIVDVVMLRKTAEIHLAPKPDTPEPKAEPEPESSQV